MKKLIVLIALICPILVSAADKEKLEKVTVTGEVFVLKGHSEKTDKQLREEAQNEAKKMALAKVCGESMNLWDIAESTSSGDDFNSLSVNQINGEVTDFDVIKEDMEVNPIRTNELRYYCTARVTVKRGVEPDPAFKAEVTGLKSVYSEGEYIELKVTPLEDAYLYIFWVDNLNQGAKIYPNIFSKNELIPANSTVKIPNAVYELVAEKNTDLPAETNKMILVFTKEKHNIVKEDDLSRQEIEQWVAGIRNDKKYLYFKVFDIRK